MVLERRRRSGSCWDHWLLGTWACSRHRFTKCRNKSSCRSTSNESLVALLSGIMARGDNGWLNIVRPFPLSPPKQGGKINF
jgi:hypothetical protein